MSFSAALVDTEVGGGVSEDMVARGPSRGHWFTPGLTGNRVLSRGLLEARPAVLGQAGRVSHCSSSGGFSAPSPPPFTLFPGDTCKLLEHLLNMTFTQCPEEHSVLSEHCSILSPVGRSRRLFY